MFSQFSALFFIACLLQGHHCSTEREDITTTYGPILTSLAANLTAEHNLSTTEVTLLETQIKDTTANTMTLISTQITTLGSTITTAKNISADNPTALSCIAVQETAAAALSTTSINETCWVGEDFPELTAAAADLQILAAIPGNTLTACTTLDPLPSQDELFESCLTDKILDLEQQLAGVRSNFETARTETLDASVQCLAQQSSVIGQKISEITYQVTLCLTLS